MTDAHKALLMKFLLKLILRMYVTACDHLQMLLIYYQCGSLQWVCDIDLLVFLT